MNELKAGDRVVRTDGGLGYQGMRGVVVAVAGGRAQVRWDDRTYPYDPFGTGDTSVMVTRKGKRTWVRFGSLRAE